MPDLDHTWSNDLTLTPSGDLATTSGPAQGTQRVLRRLLTNPGGYLWQLTYGAGLAAYVGAPVPPATLRAAVAAQLFLDHAVAAAPEPVIDIRPGPGNALTLAIRYADADTALPQSLAATIPGL